MRLILTFFGRRMWVLRHHWMGELTLTLLLPVGVYLSVAMGLEGVIRVSPEGVPFRAWIQPGLVFIITLMAAYFPIFVDLFENRRVHPFLESISASPNSSLSIVVAMTVSLLPDVILKSLIAGIILQFLSGVAFEILPFIALVFFVAILGCLIINLSLTVTMLTASPLLHLVIAFFVSLFIIFSSGWIIPLDHFPSTLIPIFSWLPTAQLLEGGRRLLFSKEVTLLTWIVPLLISLIWLVVNSIIFRRVNTL